MEESPNTWLTKRRHEDISANFRTTWDLYIKFYTVFLTFSVTALGLLAGKFTGADQVPRSLRILAIVFGIQSVLTALTSVGMILYSTKARSDQDVLANHLLGNASGPPPGSAIPTMLATWGGAANTLAMAGMAAVWFLLIL